MAVPLLRINRDVLAKFLPDHQTIIEFENLFANASSTVVAEAVDVTVDTTNFDGILSPADTNVQLALDTLDDLDLSIYSLVDGTRAFTGTVGGITPVADSDLTTKLYTDSYADAIARVVQKVESSTTETISALITNYIDILVSEKTLTISDMVDGSKIQFRNSSTGDANLAFDMIIGSNRISSPSVMPSGDSYELFYDVSELAWVM